jgi:hypothetical protein
VEHLVQQRLAADNLDREMQADLTVILGRIRSKGEAVRLVEATLQQKLADAVRLVGVPDTLPPAPIPAADAGQVVAEMKQTTDPIRLLQLAADLDFRSGPEQLQEAGTNLVKPLGKWANADASAPLAHGLAALTRHLKPRAAVRLLAAGMATTSDPEALKPLATALDARVGDLDPAEAAGVAGVLFQAFGKATRPEARRLLTESLTAVLTRQSRQLRLHGLFAAAGPASLWTADIVTAEPLPDALLVELLKHPLCVGDARRIVLAELSRRHRQPFANPWDFVRFAEENKLDLDLATPWAGRSPQ